MTSCSRIAAAVVVAVAATWSCGCGMLAGMARGEPEWRRLRADPRDFGLSAERVVLESRDRLAVTAWWLMPAATEARPPARATVVVVHGRGGNRADMLPHAKFLADAGYDVLAIDLRAHGESAGDYPSPGYLEVAEVEAAVAYARRRTFAPVVLLGYSVGAVAVLHATAAIAPVRAVIADSAFATTFGMMARVGESTRGLGLGARMGIWFISQRWLAGVTSRMLAWGGGQAIDARHADLLPVLPRIQVPVLLVTGDHDPIAPAFDAARMLAAASSPHRELLVLHAGHRTHRDAPAEYERGVLRFLDGVLPPAQASRSTQTWR